MKTLFLYGAPGSGKSTLGKLLAARLAMPFVDLDAEIVSSAGRTIPEIFAGEGEAGFRARELRALESVASRGRCVVALGGGALVADAARAVAEKSGTVVCLDCSLAVLCARINQTPGMRPLVNASNSSETRARVEGLLQRRAAHYASFKLRLDTTGRTVESLTDELEILFGNFRIVSGDEPSDIFVGTNILDSVGSFSVERGLGNNAVIVCDENTAEPYGTRVEASLRRAGIRTNRLTIPSGEEAKTLDTERMIWDAFLRGGLGRSDFAVAVGGGVVGDLVGFAAAAWMRGMKWVNVSTTLLSMADASTGGKTGCDLPGAKNMIGAFHSPSLVMLDVSTLMTLPVREWRCGLAEAVKHAVIADPSLKDRLGIFDPLRDARGDQIASEIFSEVPAGLADFVSRTLSVKVGFVRRDPFEKGERTKLNLGHTVGHALEMACHERFKHGEAVAVGTVEEAKIAVGLALAPEGWAEEVAEAFEKVGLPTKLPEGVTLESLASIMRLDKKKKDGRIRFALPCAWGDVQLNYLEV